MVTGAGVKTRERRDSYFTFSVTFRVQSVFVIFPGGARVTRRDRGNSVGNETTKMSKDVLTRIMYMDIIRSEYRKTPAK